MAYLKIYPILGYGRLLGVSTISFTDKNTLLTPDVLVAKVVEDLAGGSAGGSSLITVSGLDQNGHANSATFTLPFDATKGQVYRVGDGSVQFKDVFSLSVTPSGNAATSGAFKLIPGFQLTFLYQPVPSFSQRMWRQWHQVQNGNIVYDTIAVRDQLSLNGVLAFQNEWEILQFYKSQSFPFGVEYQNDDRIKEWDGITFDIPSNRVLREMELRSLTGQPYPSRYQNRYRFTLELVET